MNYVILHCFCFIIQVCNIKMYTNVIHKSNYDVDDFINKLLTSKKFDELIDKVADKAIHKIRHIENPLTHLTDNVTGEEFHTEQPGYNSNEHHKHISNHEYPEAFSKELDKHISTQQNEFIEKFSPEFDMDGLVQQDGFGEKLSKEYDKVSPFYHRIRKEELSKEFVIDSSIYNAKYKDKSSKEYDKESLIHTVISSKEIDKKSASANKTSKKSLTEIDPKLLRIDRTVTKKLPNSYSNELTFKYKHLGEHANAHHSDQMLEKSPFLTFRSHKKETYKEPAKENVEKVSTEETHFQDKESEPIEDTENLPEYENHEDEYKNIKHEITFSDIEKGGKDVNTKLEATQSQEHKEDLRFDLKILQEENKEENKGHSKFSSKKLVKGKEAGTEETNHFAKDYTVERSNENITENKSVNTAGNDAVLTLRAQSKSDTEENKDIVSTSDNLGGEKNTQERSTRKPSVRKEGNKFYTYVHAPEYEEYFEKLKTEKTENKIYNEKELHLLDAF